VARVKPRKLRELAQAQAMGKPFLLHLLAEVRCWIAAAVYRHANYVATAPRPCHRLLHIGYTFRRRCERECPSAALGAAAGLSVNVRARAMSDNDEFAGMSDPDFLAERKRVREMLEALTERYRVINVEFDRRAGVQWASSSRG
jgi:hypothetical protein